jgi:hypothetical protein
LVRFLAGKQDFSLPQSVLSASGAHAASFPSVAGGASAGIKAVLVFSWLMPRLRMGGTVSPLTHISSWCVEELRVCLTAYVFFFFFFFLLLLLL